LAQASLKVAGYDIGPYGIDGRAGKDTMKAVKEFQISAGLKATGELDTTTRTALELATVTGFWKHDKVNVNRRKIQEPGNNGKDQVGKSRSLLQLIKGGLEKIFDGGAKKDKSELKNGKPIDHSVLTTQKEKFKYIFGKGGSYYETEKEALSHMKTITIDIWRYNFKTRSKYSSTMKMTVNEKLANVVQKIFNEIYNDPEQFPIDPTTTGAYCWRNTPNLPNHQNGLAIDINWDANYMLKDKKILAGKEWSPPTNILSIPADKSVVKAFKKYGWGWGGEWKNVQDYMHFSYFGN